MRVSAPKMIIYATLILFLPVGAFAQGQITIWYGNVDGMPVYPDSYNRIYLDVWMLTDDDVLGASAAISVAMENYYIDTTYNQSMAMLYPPLDSWYEAYFLDPVPDGSDPDYWTCQVFIGLGSSLQGLLHFDEPTRIMTMVFWASGQNANDPVYCFRGGLHPIFGPTAIGDTTGLISYSITDYFSPVQFEPSAVSEDPNTEPDKFFLSGNYPNPFNASTTISYTLPYESDVTLDIYDILGRKVQTLYDGKQTPGEHSLIWQADNFATGTYFYRLTTDSFRQTRKMILLK